MKKIAFCMMTLFVILVVFSGCNAGNPSRQKTEVPERMQVTDAPTEALENIAQVEDDGPEAEKRAPMIKGRFTGFAESHSVEIIVGREARVFSVDERIRSDIETLAIKEHDEVMFEVKKIDQGNPIIVSILRAD